jgi:hypothetical protein
MMTIDINRTMQDLPPIGLDELLERALQQRIDRKYLLPIPALDPLLQELAPSARIPAGASPCRTW